MRPVLAALLIAALPLCALPSLAQTVPEPQGYRMDHYRDPVPATVPGAQVIDTDRAYELWQSGGAAFVDVLPRAPKPENLPKGTIWQEKPRLGIPGSLWLPNVGYGALAPQTEAYFRAGLAQATQGDPARPVVIYCLADCWMSWNAAKRAASWGYSAVMWLPQGTDGWAEWNYPTEEVTPYAP